MSSSCRCCRLTISFAPLACVVADIVTMKSNVSNADTPSKPPTILWSAEYRANQIKASQLVQIVLVSNEKKPELTFKSTIKNTGMQLAPDGSDLVKADKSNEFTKIQEELEKGMWWWWWESHESNQIELWIGKRAATDQNAMRLRAEQPAELSVIIEVFDKRPTDRFHPALQRYGRYGAKKGSKNIEITMNFYFDERREDYTDINIYKYKLCRGYMNCFDRCDELIDNQVSYTGED